MKDKLTNEKKQTAFRAVLGIIFLFVLSSCRVAENWPDSNGGCDASFLWFIPVSSDYTVLVCVVEIVAFILGLIGKFAYERAGIYHNQIRRGIYNNKGEQIGSYDTGEIETWTVSKEEEASSKVEATRAGLIIRMKSLIILTSGFILSWIFPFPRVWFWLFFIPVCIWCIRHKIDENSIDLLLIWEKIFLVICFIAIIVYETH